jgi:hypothetical protein
MISTRGADEKTQRILDEVRLKVARELPRLALVLQQHVATKSPTPEAEYLAVMVGDGGGAYEPPPLQGNQSGDDPDSGRIRFIKKPGTFLQELALAPENILVTEDTVSIGNLEFLTVNSTFQFKDMVPKRPRPGATYPTEFFTSLPYFSAFEYGTADGSGWTGEVSAGGDWYLRPDDVKNHPPGPRTMSKPIYARLAYYSGDLEAISREFLDGILESR